MVAPVRELVNTLVHTMCNTLNNHPNPIIKSSKSIINMDINFEFNISAPRDCSTSHNYNSTQLRDMSSIDYAECLQSNNQKIS